MRMVDAEQIGLTDIEIIMCDGNYKKALEMLIDKIANAPTIEVSQRMRGKWIDEGRYADYHSEHAFQCSECGGQIIENEPDSFYRWCGADMRRTE